MAASSENRTITVPKKATAAALEQAFTGLDQRFERIVLDLPTNITHASLVARFHLLQWIITARQACDFLVVKTHVVENQDYEVYLKNLASKEHSLLAFILADEVRRADGDVMPLASYRQFVSESLQRFNKTEDGDSERPDVAYRANIWALDYSKRPLLGCPPALYIGSRLKPLPDFTNAIVRKLPGGTRNLGGYELEIAASVAYELFQNTDLHARFDERREAIPNSIRGISMEHANRNSLLAQASDGTPLASYISTSIQNGATDFLSVSVFDSGIGIPEHQRMRTHRLRSEETDAEIVKRCFAEPSNRSVNLGRGLPTVRRLLVERKRPGFMYLRSGEAHVYMDGLQGDRLQIWRSESPEGHSTTRGTLFSIVLPY